MDEWNYWSRPYEYGELGCIYRLRDALGVAAGLHEYFRNTDIIAMAHYAQTVNVIGCINFATTALPLMLYRKHFGTLPVAVQTEGNLDVMAALSKDGKTLTVGIVNPTLRPGAIRLELLGARAAGQAVRWQIAGDPMAFNEPGKQPRVRAAGHYRSRRAIGSGPIEHHPLRAKAEMSPRRWPIPGKWPRASRRADNSPLSRQAGRSPEGGKGTAA